MPALTTLTTWIMAASLLLPTHTQAIRVNRVESIYALWAVNGDGGGTAFLVTSPKGKEYLLTNRHVCEGAYVVEMGGELFPAEKVEIASNTDLCLLIPPAPVSKADRGLTIADSAPSILAPIHIIGQGQLLGNALTRGHFVAQLRQVILSVTNPYYVTAPVLPGNSGSPAFDEHGKVFGVVFASSQAIDNRALLVPLEDIKAFLAPY
jgi:S1-C subfamily serine protease